MRAKTCSQLLDNPFMVKTEMRDCIQHVPHHNYGRVFKEVRLAKDLSIDEFAEWLNISAFRLELIEEGAAILPTRYLMEALTTLFQLHELQGQEKNISITNNDIFCGESHIKWQLT